MSGGTAYLAALGAWTCVCACAALAVTRLKPESAARWESLPRASIPGAVLGLIDLLWCIPNVKPILSESLHPALLPAAFALAILGWIFLDKLLARAIGGFLILLAHYFLKESFAAGAPGAELFAALCFVAGTFGIFVSGKPHLLRDFIRRACASGAWRIAAAAFFGAFTLSSALTLLLLAMRGAAA